MMKEGKTGGGNFVKSKYGTEISKDDYKEIMLLSKEVNRLFEEHYIKEIRPEPIHPIKRMKNFSGQKSVQQYKAMLRSMLFEEQDNPGGRFENWKQQMKAVTGQFDRVLSDAIDKMTQADYKELKDMEPDVVNVKFHYDVIVVKDKNTGGTKSVDNNMESLIQRTLLEQYLIDKGYLRRKNLLTPKIGNSRKYEESEE